MSSPLPVPSVIAVWAKGVLTYGAAAVACVTAGVYLALQRADQVALAEYGLDASAFSVGTGEMIVRGISSLLVLAGVMLVIWLPVGRPISWIASKLPKPGLLQRLEDWVLIDPSRQAHKAIASGLAGVVPLIALALFCAGTSIGKWRTMSADWIVTANGCASGCFSYTVEGRKASITGRVLATNATRMAVVVGHNRAEVIGLDKVISVEAHTGKPLALDAAPWWMRSMWRVLDVVNGRWWR